MPILINDCTDLVWISPDQVNALSLNKATDLKHEWKELAKCDQQWGSKLRTCLHAGLQSNTTQTGKLGGRLGKLSKYYILGLCNITVDAYI